METLGKKNIFQKMLAITSDLSIVAKNLEVGFGANKYKATGEADVLAAIKPLEEKYGIYSYPVKREILETAELEIKSGTKNLFLRIATTYRFVNTENPSEFIEITSYGDGVDSQDKSVGKAMTYSDKYALMKAYKIITGDDPDQNLSEELKGKRVSNVKQNNSYGSSNDEFINTEKMIDENQLNILVAQNDSIKTWALNYFKVNNLSDLSYAQANALLNKLKEKGVIR